jgi:hypothetical protein
MKTQAHNRRTHTARHNTPITIRACARTIVPDASTARPYSSDDSMCIASPSERTRAQNASSVLSFTLWPAGHECSTCRTALSRSSGHARTSVAVHASAAVKSFESPPDSSTSSSATAASAIAWCATARATCDQAHRASGRWDRRRPTGVPGLALLPSPSERWLSLQPLLLLSDTSAARSAEESNAQPPQGPRQGRSTAAPAAGFASSTQLITRRGGGGVVVPAPVVAREPLLPAADRCVMPSPAPPPVIAEAQRPMSSSSEAHE